MKLAIMQPYFFPYIGYWQLIHAVDRFVIYDDVNYIKGGWINRNRILINGHASYLTIPLKSSSPYKRICEIELAQGNSWRSKMIKTIAITYRNAPHFETVFPVLESVVRYDVPSLVEYLTHQLRIISTFLGIQTNLVISSNRYDNNNLSGQTRVIDICQREAATCYINSQGGMELYDGESFRQAGIDLRFIVMHPLPYRQRGDGFVSNLSIVDALMELGPKEIKTYLDAFELRVPEPTHADLA